MIKFLDPSRPQLWVLVAGLLMIGSVLFLPMPLTLLLLAGAGVLALQRLLTNHKTTCSLLIGSFATGLIFPGPQLAVAAELLPDTVSSSEAPDAPNANLLVPLHVVEPARWVVDKPRIGRSAKETIRVSYSDLDLSKAAAVSELYERLQSASERVCRGSVRMEVSNNSAEEQLCISGVLAKAVSQVGLHSLDKIHSG